MIYIKLSIVVFLSFIWAGLAAAAEKANTCELWLDSCARCHGDTGRGDTPLGKKLKVRDYSTQQAQADFTDEYLHKMIMDGKIIDGKKVMPSYREELNEKQVAELVAYIRALTK